MEYSYILPTIYRSEWPPVCNTKSKAGEWEEVEAEEEEEDEK